ncbi:hypothetical protein HanOQP8_Chr04g0129241 [Helianthus annuus]|nr:hypothetical protein HanOQP8_Chr04g0129241 [Helianthus annuus]
MPSTDSVLLPRVQGLQFSASDLQTLDRNFMSLATLNISWKRFATVKALNAENDSLVRVRAFNFLSILLMFDYAKAKVWFCWIVDWSIGPMVYRKCLIGLWIDALVLGCSGIVFSIEREGWGYGACAGKRKGRKRKRKDGEDVDKPEKTARKMVLAIRSVVLIERVVYEDGDFEDLETHEAKALLVGTMKRMVLFVNGRSLLISMY